MFSKYTVLFLFFFIATHLSANNLANQLRRNICNQVMGNLAKQGIIWKPNGGGVKIDEKVFWGNNNPRRVQQPRVVQPAPQPVVQNIPNHVGGIQRQQFIPQRPWLNSGKTPLSKIITYQQWTSLLMRHVGKIPELVPYWQWAQQTGSDIYYGGGTLRGLKHWLYVQLQHHHYNVVWNIQTPSIHQLQLQEGSDIDLWAPDELIQRLKTELPMYANWDILGDSFHRGNVKLGGPTLEKIRINPWKHDDPLNGLAHYYEGKLVFHWTPELEFRESFWVDKRGNSRTTEALRYVRFLYNLPELSLDEESKQNIHNIISNEADILYRSETTDYWIKKSLKKLLIATGYNMVETVDALREMRLLQIMGRYQYNFEFKASLPDYVGALVNRGFSLGELKWVQRMFPPQTVEECIRFMNSILYRVQTAEEFLILAKPHITNPSNEYLQEINIWILNNLGKFLIFSPSQEQKNRLIYQMHLTTLSNEQIHWIDRDLR